MMSNFLEERHNRYETSYYALSDLSCAVSHALTVEHLETNFADTPRARELVRLEEKIEPLLYRLDGAADALRNAFFDFDLEQIDRRHKLSRVGWEAVQEWNRAKFAAEMSA